MTQMDADDRKQIKMLVEILGRVGVIIFYSMLAVNIWGDLQTQFRLSNALLLLQELLIVMMVLCRRDSITVSARPIEWFMAIFGTCIGLFMRAHGDADYLIADIISSIGVVVVISGLSILSRSFGLVPANRGIKTGGIYRIVRHPLYAGYNIIYIGFLINNFSLSNICVTVLWFAAQTARIIFEERHLSQYEEYREFKKRTRWRILPGVW